MIIRIILGIVGALCLLHGGGLALTFFAMQAAFGGAIPWPPMVIAACSATVGFGLLFAAFGDDPPPEEKE